MPDFTFDIAAAVVAFAEDADEPGIVVPIDFLLDANGDIDVSTGDLQWSSGLEGVREACDSAIRLVLGEWYLDLAVGVDYWNKILIKGPNLLVVNQLIRDAILSVPFVSEVLSVGVTFDAATRRLSVAWRARCDFGVVSSTSVLGV